MIVDNQLVGLLCFSVLLWGSCSGATELPQVARGHIFLLTNATDGVVLTYVNTHNTTESVNVSIDGRHLSPPFVCGERNGRCQMTPVSNSDESILVFLIPLSDGIQLVSYRYENGSYTFEETWFIQQAFPNCHVAFFAKSDRTSPRFISYCLDPSTYTLRSMQLFVDLQQLNRSQAVIIDVSFDVGDSDVILSNFLFFENFGSISDCFSNSLGHTVFLRDGDLVDHSIEDQRYDSHGNIGTPSCSVYEPRLQVLGRECMMTAYCNDTTALFGTPESFTSNPQVSVFTEERDGQVFFCNSATYVRLKNNSLSVETVSGDTSIGTLTFDDQRIILGDCLVSLERRLFFVALLSDLRVVLVNFHNLTTYLLAESGNETLQSPVPYSVQGDLLIVNNRSHTIAYNWTSTTLCGDDVITVDTTFDLVVAFVDRTITEVSGCVPAESVATTTEDVPIDTTTSTTDVIGPTEATSEVESTSAATTEVPTTAMSSAILSVGERILIAVGTITFCLIVTFFVIIGAILYIRRYRHTHGRVRFEVNNPTRLSIPNGNIGDGNTHTISEDNKDGSKDIDKTHSPSKEAKQRLNLLNNDSTDVDELNNIELSSPPVLQTSVDVTQVADVHNETAPGNNVARIDDYPITIEAKVEETPTMDRHRNDSQLVMNSSSSPAIGSRGISGSTNDGPPSTSQDAADLLPHPVDCSDDHTPSSSSSLTADISGAEVTTQAQDVTEIGPNTHDLVPPAAQCPIRPNKLSVEGHMEQVERRHGYQPDAANLPGPNNDS